MTAPVRWWLDLGREDPPANPLLVIVADDDELTTTVAPRSDNRRAVSSPIPLEDPVTTATRPLNSDIPPV